MRKKEKTSIKGHYKNTGIWYMPKEKNKLSGYEQWINKVIENETTQGIKIRERKKNFK